MNTPTVAVLVSRIRVEEKLLFAALETAGARLQIVQDSDLIFHADNAHRPFAADVVLERSLSTTRGIYALRLLEQLGIPTVNRYATAATCAAAIGRALATATRSTPRRAS